MTNLLTTNGQLKLRRGKRPHTRRRRSDPQGPRPRAPPSAPAPQPPYGNPGGILPAVVLAVQREIIRERIHSGLARARAKGKRLGRKPVPAAVESQIRKLAKDGMGKLKIARVLETGTLVVQRVLKETSAG